jgi:spermatogenesis-associated protein 2
MVKAMTAAILDKQQQRKSKAVSQGKKEPIDRGKLQFDVITNFVDNCYHNQQINSCNIHQCVPNQQPPNHYYTPQPQPPVQQTGYHHGPPPCSVHPHQTVYGSYGNGQLPPPIPHSKSLDYYEPVLHSGGYMNSHYHQPHRHSMDQTFDYGGPQMSQGYDCVDGDHQCGNVTYNNHPYNVSGNRVPLPYDLGTSYPPQHLPPPPLPPQATYYSRLQHPNTEQQFSNSGTDFYCPVMVGGSGQQYLPNNVASPIVPMDKLIDFDQQQQHQSNGSAMRGNGYYSKRDKEQQSDYLPATLMTKSHHNGSVHNHYNQPTLGMDIPPPLFARNVAKASGRTHDKYGKATVCVEDSYNNKQHYQITEKSMKNLNLSDFDSFEDDNSSSQPRSNKNMDGIGNYESWNYVFRNLEQQGELLDIGPIFVFELGVI